jgi:EmrB/QacA subfamily drug resistance transporter
MGQAEERAYERRWLILVVMCFSLLIIVLDNSILNVAIPTIQEDLGASQSQLQWMVDSYTLVFAGLLLTAGSLGDRYGRRGALQLGFVIFGLGSLLSSLAGNAPQLIATRALMGVGGAFIMPATLSIITNVFPAEERGRAIGAWAGVAGLGAAIGPLTGGFLIQHFYWGSIFLVNLPIVVVGLLAGFFLIPTSKDPSSPRLDLVGAALSIVGLGSLLYGIIEGPSEGWSSGPIVAGLVVGVVLITAFIFWEIHSSHPMIDVRLFKNPRFSAASTAITMVFFAMFGSIFLLTQYLQFVLHYSALDTGIRLLPFALTMMVAAPSSARVVERIGSKITVAAGLALVTLGLVLTTGLDASSSYGNIVWRLMVMSLGMGFVMAPATDSVMGSLPLAKAGVGSAVNDTTRQVGGALGVAAIGSVLSSGYSSAMAGVLGAYPQLNQLPSDLTTAAQNSIGGAQAMAGVVRGLPFPGASAVADSIANGAADAFVDGFHHAVLLGAAATAFACLAVVVFLPARARASDAELQEREYELEHATDGAPSVAPATAREDVARDDGASGGQIAVAPAD